MNCPNCNSEDIIVHDEDNKIYFCPYCMNLFKLENQTNESDKSNKKILLE